MLNFHRNKIEISAYICVNLHISLKQNNEFEFVHMYACTYICIYLHKAILVPT